MSINISGSLSLTVNAADHPSFQKENIFKDLAKFDASL
jgi:hypothetical protein